MLAIAAAFLFVWTPAVQPAVPDTTSVPVAVPAQESVAVPSSQENPQQTSLAASHDSHSSSSAILVASTGQPGETGSNDAAPHLTEANYAALSLIRVPDPAALRNSKFIGVERSPSRRKWLTLTLAQHGAAAFDAYSTRLAISNGAVERDPLMRPFANSSGIYAAIQVVPIALDYTARKMQRNSNPFLRRIWWMPQAASTATFIFSGVHNLHVANQP